MHAHPVTHVALGPAWRPNVGRLTDAALRVATAGVSAGDSEELRTRKVALTVASLVIASLASAWVATYLVLGHGVAAAIPVAYQVLTVAGLVVFARTKDFERFRTLEIGLVLVLPFALQWTVGGYEASSLVSLWGLVAALGGVVFSGARGSVPWFLAFVGLTVVSTLFDPLLARHALPVPPVLRTAFYGLNVAGVAVTGWLSVVYFVRGRERAMAELDREHRALLGEQARANALLHDVLPDPVAERLKSSPGTIADGPCDATILFADIVGFTALAERTDPAALVGMLDRVFSAFDDLVAARGLEKVKTIGDAYMVVGGVPSPRADHVDAVAGLALELCALAQDTAGGDGIQLRMGIASGPVIAGVIGRRRFGWDLWGDAVNTAARMEQTSEPSRIQVTDEVRRRLADRFRFAERGEIDVKGKGPMRTWFLVGAA